ncbi:MAG: CoA transferase [Gammaproteobacteria bacterium]|nr:CoA transferase [Gammaproteobacteria bacterium]
MTPHTGPLNGLRILELAGIGPVPFCGMLFSDLGADVVRIDRTNAPAQGRGHDRYAVETRGRRSVALDLKTAADRDVALALIGRADALIEGYRPDVMERLGLGPDAALARNPKLVYGRMTGWGQTGPYATAPGHDINYVALSGALHALGPKERPAVPLNLIGDFGGGALYLAFGIMAALRHVELGGEGQVVDCAMTEGAISMMGMLYGEFAAGRWKDERESNIIDGAAPFYNVYECADGRWISIASIEPPFYAALLEKVGVTDAGLADQMNAGEWPEQRRKLEAVFRQRTRDEWCALLEGTEACFAPVLSLAEAPAHSHNAARGSFVEVDGVVQPAPLPRFSRTPGAVRHGPVRAGDGAAEALRDWGVDEALAERFR